MATPLNTTTSQGDGGTSEVEDQWRMGMFISNKGWDWVGLTFSQEIRTGVDLA